MKTIGPICEGCHQLIEDLSPDKIKIIFDDGGKLKPRYRFICPEIGRHATNPYLATPEVPFSEISWAVREGVQDVHFNSIISEFDIYKRQRIEEDYGPLEESEVSDWVRIDLALMKEAITAHRDLAIYVAEYAKIETA